MALLESKAEAKDAVVVEHEISGSSYNPAGSVEGIERGESENIQKGAVKYACDIMSLCNDARLIGNDLFGISTNDSDSKPQFIIEGEPTEAALAVVVEKLGPFESDDTEKNPSKLANQNKLHFTNRWERYATLEFDRKRKSMSVLCTQKDNNECMLMSKGAPNMVLDRCTRVKLRDGSIAPLSQNIIDQIEATISSIGDRALRCIGLAYKEGNELDPILLKENGQYDTVLRDSSNFVAIEDGMTFCGLVAIRDPPRPNVAQSGEYVTMLVLEI
jgi:Ca2+-transporting ATPase